MLKTDTRDASPVCTGAGFVEATGVGPPVCLLESPWVVGDSAGGDSLTGWLGVGSDVGAGALFAGAVGVFGEGVVGAVGAGAGAGAGGGGAAFAP